MATPPSAFLKLGIVGYPLGHTLSPLLHTALMSALDLAGEYRACEVPPEGLADKIRQLQAEGCRGLNVTIPHKIAAMALVDDLLPEGRLVRAVNTLVFEGGRILGTNTDVTGFERSLPQGIHSRLHGGRALVLGAGGACRAVVAALLRLRVGEVVLAVRDPNRASDTLAMARRVRAELASPAILSLMRLDQALALSSFCLVVNTTPVGMSPLIDESPLPRAALASLRPDALVCDLIYRPLQTLLLREAETFGLETLSGLPMLVYQGVEAFQLWSGVPVSPDVTARCLDVLASALARNS